MSNEVCTRSNTKPGDSICFNSISPPLKVEYISTYNEDNYDYDKEDIIVVFNDGETSYSDKLKNFMVYKESE